MRVVHVLPTYDSAGPSNVCYGICRGLAQSGVDASIISLRPPDPAALPRLAEAGIELHSLNMRGLWDSSPRGPLRDLLSRLAPEVAHTHGLRPDTLAAPIARAQGVPVVLSTVHCALLDYYRLTLPYPLAAWPTYLWQRRALQRSTDAIVFVSDAARRSLVHSPFLPLRHPCMRVIHNGVPARQLGLGPDTPVADDIRALKAAGLPLVGAVAVLTPLKNLASLLRAAACCRDRGVPCQIVLVGDGEERAALQTLAVELGLDAHTHLLGYRSDVPRILPGLDAFALTSRTEGLPLAVIEAMLSGVPVLATRVGGVPEIIRDGETGLLVPAGDDAALAAQVHRLLTQPDLRRQLAEAGRAHAEAHLTDTAMADQYLSLYRELLDVRPARP